MRIIYILVEVLTTIDIIDKIKLINREIDTIELNVCYLCVILYAN